MENRIKQYFEVSQFPASPPPAPAPLLDDPKFLFVHLHIPLDHPRIAEILFTVKYLWDLILNK